jgi:DNA mismatch repair ATPase MutL
MASRRSERGRSTAQPPPTTSTHSVSSSSASSNRADRVTRSNNKTNSSNKSSTPNSLSSEELDDQTGSGEPPQTRLRNRGQDNDDHEPKIPQETEEGDEDGVVRCVCGFMDFPGPPQEGMVIMEGDEAVEFIQCDECQAWQHGACVCLLSQDEAPENYYCEECKPELHELLENSHG